MSRCVHTHRHGGNIFRWCPSSACLRCSYGPEDDLCRGAWIATTHLLTISAVAETSEQDRGSGGCMTLTCLAADVPLFSMSIWLSCSDECDRGGPVGALALRSFHLAACGMPTRSQARNDIVHGRAVTGPFCSLDCSCTSLAT
jgi:hypothetical protein